VRGVVRIALYAIAVLVPPVALFATKQWLNGVVSIALIVLSWVFLFGTLGTGAFISFGMYGFIILHAVICTYLRDTSNSHPPSGE
jgi:hypothetical protein